MFWILRRKRKADAGFETSDMLDVARIAEDATQGMPMSAAVRNRALPQLMELLDGKISACGVAFSGDQLAAMRAEFRDTVLGEFAPKPATPAPHAPDTGHFGHIEGIVAAAFDAEFDGTPERVLAVGTQARRDVARYLQSEGLDDPALAAAAERAIAEHMGALLR